MESAMTAHPPSKDLVDASAAPPASPSSELGVTFETSGSKGHHITLEREDTLETIFGTADLQQATALLSHCLMVLKPDEVGDAGPFGDQRTFMLSIIKDLGPRDAVERMLTMQMAATHVAVVRAAKQMATAQHPLQVAAYTTAFTKISRSFAAQVEALQKHRSGGKQTVVVQHVNVADGGQAIVGHVQTNGRTRGEGSL